jgi:hypothetical protein
LIQLPSNYTNIHPSLVATLSFFIFLLLLFLLLFFFKLLFIHLFTIIIWAAHLNKRYCIKSQSKLLPHRENLSSHVFFLWHRYKLYWLPSCKKCGPRTNSHRSLLEKCEKYYSVFIDPSRVTKMEICFIFLWGSVFFKKLTLRTLLIFTTIT